MVLGAITSSVSYSFERVGKLERHGLNTAKDPLSWIAGGIAGAVGRAAVVPLDQGGAKGPAQAIFRRVPQTAILFGLYVPIASTMNNDTHNPQHKLISTFVIGSVAGYWMRAITNPIGRVLDESQRMNVTPREAANRMRAKTILHFYYCSPPLVANALYFGSLFTAFEGIRRFAERNGAPVNGVVGSTIVNGACGAAAATVASVATFPFSAHRYSQVVIHDSAIVRGLPSTLMKEVPMMAVTFATFSFISQGINSYQRGGFGY